MRSTRCASHTSSGEDKRIYPHSDSFTKPGQPREVDQAAWVFARTEKALVPPSPNGGKACSTVLDGKRRTGTEHSLTSRREARGRALGHVRRKCHVCSGVGLKRCNQLLQDSYTQCCWSDALEKNKAVTVLDRSRKLKSCWLCKHSLCTYLRTKSENAPELQDLASYSEPDSDYLGGLKETKAIL